MEEEVLLTRMVQILRHLVQSPLVEVVEEPTPVMVLMEAVVVV